VGSCKHGNEPANTIKAGNFLASSANIIFSRRTLLPGIG